MILVDYRCATCEGLTEHRVTTPPPAEVGCPACGGRARRRYSPVGVVGRANAPRPTATADLAPSCRDNPDVPGLCHMTPAAARAWVARARSDNRRLERELERQERSVHEHGTPIGDPVSHDHGAGAGHGHSHRPAAADGTATPTGGST